MRTGLILLLTLLLSGCNQPAEKTESGFIGRDIELRGVTYRYQVFLPTAGDETKRPVVMFLHGVGELGYDGVKPTHVGLGPYLRTTGGSFPAIAVFPQAPDNTRWIGEVNQIAMAALDSTLKEFNGDPDRVYLTGLSMGAVGTLMLAAEHPDRFAALAPVCTSLSVGEGAAADQNDRSRVESPQQNSVVMERLSRLKNIPIWLFHGANDDLVPPANARHLYEALKSIGAEEVRYTEFPKTNHNCWDPTYSNTPELWDWLFTKRRRT